MFDDRLQSCPSDEYQLRLSVLEIETKSSFNSYQTQEQKKVKRKLNQMNPTFDYYSMTTTHKRFKQILHLSQQRKAQRKQKRLIYSIKQRNKFIHILEIV